MTNIAIENCHRNSWCLNDKWWLSTALLVIPRGYTGWWFGTCLLCSHVLGILSPQLTKTYFSEGWLNNKPVYSDSSFYRPSSQSPSCASCNWGILLELLVSELPQAFILKKAVVSPVQNLSQVTFFGMAQHAGLRWRMINQIRSILSYGISMFNNQNNQKSSCGLLFINVFRHSNCAFHVFVCFDPWKLDSGGFAGKSWPITVCN